MNTKTIEVGASTFEYLPGGNTGPVIVFLNGFRMPLASWEKLSPEIQLYGRTFAYNRPGVGKSSKAAHSQTGEVVVSALRELLTAFALPSPYILVAHSLGGIFANLYARCNPDEVSAIIFIEAAHPTEIERQRDLKPPVAIRAINDGMKAIERIFSRYKYSEDECINDTLRQIATAGDFPQIPVAVVTGSKKMPFVPQASFDIHLQCQQELLALSANSCQYFAAQSGHFPQITEPNVVLAAIKETVAKVTGG